MDEWFREDMFICESQTRTAYGGHIRCMIDTKYRHFVQDLSHIIPTKQQFIFRAEYALNIRQQVTMIPHGDHVLSNLDEMGKLLDTSCKIYQPETKIAY